MCDRLVELCREAQAKYLEEEPPVGDFGAYLADHLIANGVIVPPCKVGDIIYALTYDRKDYMPLKVTSRESLVRWMDEGQFGHALFTTREEAKQALKGDSNA